MSGNSSFIQKILNDRSVLGELQPHTFINGKDGERERVKDGAPILGYYPRIIDDTIWHRAQAAKARRLKEKGRNGNFINILKGMVVNARDGEKCHCQRTAAYGKKRVTYIQRRWVWAHLGHSDGTANPR